MSANLERAIAEIIGNEIKKDPESITAATTLESLDVNSLELVEIIMSIEEEYDVSIDLDAVSASESLKTVGDLMELGKSLGIGADA